MADRRSSHYHQGYNRASSLPLTSITEIQILLKSWPWLTGWQRSYTSCCSVAPAEVAGSPSSSVLGKPFTGKYLARVIPLQNHQRGCWRKHLVSQRCLPLDTEEQGAGENIWAAEIYSAAGAGCLGSHICYRNQD